MDDAAAGGSTATWTYDSMLERLRAMQAAQRRAGAPTYEDRLQRLDRLERALLAHKDDIAKAVAEDFGNRSRHESLVADVYLVKSTLAHVRDHLREWMDVQAREVNWTSLPARNEVILQPLGVVGIIVPWNYPVQLALSPLVGVLAAGNRAMIKPSELVPKTSAVMAKLLRDAFDPDLVDVFEGGVEVGADFARLPFDHLVFTGSTRVGKLVMRAAAENLTPVTLELGGKSPVIVGSDCDLEKAAHSIMAGKCYNAGQTCIAPDYVLLPRASVQPFVEACRGAVAGMYPTLAANADYTSIVNPHHYARLGALVEDARTHAKDVVELNPSKETLPEEGRKIAPTLVVEPTDDAKVMEEEIFGPVLPIVPYGSLDEALAFVNERPRPLALYFFGHDQGTIDRVLSDTVSGGVCVNETMLHCVQDDLPFGGVGPSGMGHYHGREGFEAFSKKKAVFHQSRLNGMGLLRPPYGKAMDMFLKILLR